MVGIKLQGIERWKFPWVRFPKKCVNVKKPSCSLIRHLKISFSSQFVKARLFKLYAVLKMAIIKFENANLWILYKDCALRFLQIKFNIIQKLESSAFRLRWQVERPWSWSKIQQYVWSVYQRYLHGDTRMLSVYLQRNYNFLQMFSLSEVLSSVLLWHSLQVEYPMYSLSRCALRIRYYQLSCLDRQRLSTEIW